jgi:anaerobic selenocysteine-containing dehydrogenase
MTPLCPFSRRPAFDLPKEHLKKYTPEHVGKITGVPAATVRRIAREFGEAAEADKKPRSCVQRTV